MTFYSVFVNLRKKLSIVCSTITNLNDPDSLVVGEPEIQKLEKSAGKQQNLSSVSMVFQKCENRYCTNFKSCNRCLFMG